MGEEMAFPEQRLRRTRRTAGLRGLVRETELSPGDFIYPIFVAAGEDVRNEIPSMPGILQLSINHAVKEAQRAHALGTPGVLLFGIPEDKDEAATGAYDPEGVVQLATRAIKDAVPELLVVTDVCLCEYMSHGHCGVVDKERGEVLNDVSLELLARTAVSHAEAGADLVAPSDMMDGRVAAIRSELDREGYENTPIMAYAAKYASAFYGPFREAAESTPQFGDRRNYQIDPANAREALREVGLDAEEGADIVIVKPALPYLDVVRRVREQTDLPVAAYNVSGEFSMIKAAAEKGWLDERGAVLEALTGVKRAGAEIIISYHAPDVARWLSE
jgi:porphobilinogen synthase